MKDDQEKEIINENEEEQTNQESNVEKQNNEQEIGNLEQETIEENQNEEPVVEPKKKKKGSYILGTIGALLGGFVAAIPWILTYTYAHMIIAALATIIAGGAYLGYKIFKGKIGKAFPVIITIVSLIIVTIVTTVVCPTILMAQSDFPITFENLKGLYSDVQAEIRTAIFEDLAISLFFTIIGIVAIAKSMSIQIKNNSGKVEFSTKALEEEAKNELKQQSEAVKKACTSLKSINKENAVTKQEILNELEMTYNVELKNAKQYLKACLSYKLLKKHKGKYYYDEAGEQVAIEKSGNIKTSETVSKGTLIAILAIIIIGIVASIIYLNKPEKYTIPNENIQLNISNSQTLYGTSDEITEAFGDDAAYYYDFIIKDDEADKYDIYGQVISKSTYEGYDFATIMQNDRDYYAEAIKTDTMSEVLDKKLDNREFKAYNFTYTGNDEKQYRAVTYLYEAESNYVWINVYADIDIEFTQIDSLIEKLFK